MSEEGEGAVHVRRFSSVNRPKGQLELARFEWLLVLDENLQTRK